MVLLGLRASYKSDIKSSAAEMVYGTILKLPGEYFTAEDPIGCPQIFIEKLRERIRMVRGPPTAHHTRKKTFLDKEMEDCTHVFVRVDRPRGPLELPYEGPFPIITRLSDFIYRINYKGHPEAINTDRLKPALIEQEDTSTPDDPPPTTHQPLPSTSSQDHKKQG
ncbi:PREDICTED: uncharacterized protein LOC108774631 [Cyphomyrmex costatus]|uniref:uncharacterized protein LOC108774631 n=1 Tax=Cyphomyrmex costatus TaxID=456900 RepID=UPI000852460E|nr:PREDICTED: uncharacterized protein LOC108774631 [Cyphomyrmex costatus]